MHTFQNTSPGVSHQIASSSEFASGLSSQDPESSIVLSDFPTPRWSREFDDIVATGVVDHDLGFLDDQGLSDFDSANLLRSLQQENATTEENGPGAKRSRHNYDRSQSIEMTGMHLRSSGSTSQEMSRSGNHARQIQNAWRILSESPTTTHRDVPTPTLTAQYRESPRDESQPQRYRSHLMAEKKYRSNLGGKFEQLKYTLIHSGIDFSGNSDNPNLTKMNKALILEQAVFLIQNLQATNRERAETISCLENRIKQAQLSLLSGEYGNSRVPPPSRTVPRSPQWHWLP